MTNVSGRAREMTVLKFCGGVPIDIGASRRYSPASLCEELSIPGLKSGES